MITSFASFSRPWNPSSCHRAECDVILRSIGVLHPCICLQAEGQCADALYLCCLDSSSFLCQSSYSCLSTFSSANWSLPWVSALLLPSLHRERLYIQTQTPWSAGNPALACRGFHPSIIVQRSFGHKGLFWGCPEPCSPLGLYNKIAYLEVTLTESLPPSLFQNDVDSVCCWETLSAD